MLSQRVPGRPASRGRRGRRTASGPDAVAAADARADAADGVDPVPDEHLDDEHQDEQLVVEDGSSPSPARPGLGRLVTEDLPRTANGIATEVRWISQHLARYPLGMVVDRSGGARRRRYGLSLSQRGLIQHDLDAAGTPILLVHGIVDNHTIFTSLERALRRRGFERLRFFDYGLLTTDVRATATRLGRVVEDLLARTGRDRIHVIGHSLGGLIARYYVQRLGGDAHVHTLVTLGSPHQGTELAQVGRVLPLVRQLTPRSELIRELSEPAPGCRTRFLVFWSDLDQLMVPRRNARLAHPDLAVTNVAVRGVGHMSLTNNRTIAARIAESLANLTPPEPAGAGRPAGTARASAD
ncbi:hypothetical protein FHX74_000823 [Friedmanniella endophytica]|uniref:AB hydrolase-1 domain-containing protein n=1 Tax=Microlunatus kandeliicorticis TaxID=1759536 RepID=A0A7W3P4T3_9ACTN|nr:alpha/beta fold hydrolase [Microlunatus kandeliicorticis]MBA8793229.1 hypothetical protein [Microlunatus kandeliicorticis]